LPIDLDGRRSFQAEGLDPPDQTFWYASRFHPLEFNSIQFNSNSYLMQPEYGDLAMQAFVDRRRT
jgi:hypothetical protein